MSKRALEENIVSLRNSMYPILNYQTHLDTSLKRLGTQLGPTISSLNDYIQRLRGMKIDSSEKVDVFPLYNDF